MLSNIMTQSGYVTESVASGNVTETQDMICPKFGWIYNIPTYTHHQDLMNSVGGVVAAHRCCCS